MNRTIKRIEREETKWIRNWQGVKRPAKRLAIRWQVWIDGKFAASFSTKKDAKRFAEA